MGTPEFLLEWETVSVGRFSLTSYLGQAEVLRESVYVAEDKRNNCLVPSKREKEGHKVGRTSKLGDT